MPKRTGPQPESNAAEHPGVPGGSKLTNAELMAAWKPASAILDKHEHQERNRLESEATEMRERFPEARDRVDRWLAAQTDVLAEMLGGLRDSLRAFSDRTAEGEKFRATFLDMTPAQVDEHLRTHTIDAAWLAGFTKDDSVKREFYSNLTKPARDAARAARIMRGGSDWRSTARDYAAGNDPDTGKPWRTKKRMCEWIGKRLDKDPETVRKALNSPRRK